MRLIFIFLLLFSGCQPCFSFSQKLPPVQTPPANPSPSPTYVDASAGLDKIFKIMTESDCAKSPHDVQGTPPKSYMKGIGLTYIRVICGSDSPEYHAAAHTVDLYKAITQPIGDPKKDALAYYGIENGFANDRLNATFALMIGSAARESSWRWCVGKDPGANNATAETAEAGLYQTSWNSRQASPVLKKLFDEYVEYPGSCYGHFYKGSTVCSASNMKNWGTGDGAAFQQLSKECPGFATEYHAVMVRMNRTHYGPINQKKSLLKKECVSMFEQLRQEVVKDPNLCFVI